MHFARASLLALVTLSLGVAAASLPQQANSHGLVERASRADTQTELVKVLTAESSLLEKEDDKLSKLNVNNVTADQVRPIFQEMSTSTQKAGEEIKKLLAEIKKVDSNEKRQELLQPAVYKLFHDLNKILHRTRPLVRHLLNNLELSAVQSLIKDLGPGVDTLLDGVESLVNELTPGLGQIVDPLLHTVYGLTDSLGLNLNAPAARDLTQASAQSEFAKLAKDESDELNKALTKLNKIDADSVTIKQLEPIFKDLSSSMKASADKIRQLNDEYKKQGAASSKRQELLAPAVNELVASLNKILLKVEPLLRHLTKNLDLGTVQDLVDLLTPGLVSLIGGVEALLVTIAPGLALLVDPLLKLVYGILGSLGLNLNAPLN